MPNETAKCQAGFQDVTVLKQSVLLRLRLIYAEQIVLRGCKKGCEFRRSNLSPAAMQTLHRTVNFAA